MHIDDIQNLFQAHGGFLELFRLRMGIKRGTIDFIYGKPQDRRTVEKNMGTQ